MNKKQSGRSTRMMQDAAQAVDERRAVYVILAPISRPENFLRLLGDRAERYRGRIKFETFGTLPNYDIDTGRLRGAWQNCVVLVDHFAIEHRHYNLIHLYEKYDL